MSNTPFFLLVNPWITDFAAHDLWAKPMGLLLLASLLRDGGCGVALVDCLDRHDQLTKSLPGVLPGADRLCGTGKYPKMLIEKPEVYRDVPRRYFRYGLHPDSFRKHLEALPRPDLIWVSSTMTYWYPGVQQTIAMLREVFPETPIWLGGIYARLCPSHALMTSGADEVITSPMAELPGRVEAATGFILKNRVRWNHFESWLSPALDLLPRLTYAPILTSLGCPFRCPYCASGILQPLWARRSADDLFSEISRWHSDYGIVDFAFYDDALLIDAESTLKKALERICGKSLRLRFHTPNALHIRALTPDWCSLLHESGFTTLRLGLETTRPERQKQWGGKVEREMFFLAIERLLVAGFSGEQIGAYLLCGLPGQSPEEVAETIRDVRLAGIQPFISEYSPVPGTSMWSEAATCSKFPIEEEPLYQNNSFFACRRPDFSYEDLLHLKYMALQARRSISQNTSV
jgi:radical SAM superfamily enzyme YgiQ (UPF0313 family)